MTATAGQSKVQIPALAPGLYHAVCTMVIDLGIQHVPAFKRSDVHQVRILWEIVGETISLGEKVHSRLVSKDYTLSLDERSNLFGHLQSWRGEPFTDEELKNGFDLSRVCGANCQLLLIQKPGKRGPYSVVDSIIPLQKGIRRHKAEKTFYFDMDDSATYGVFAELPRYVQEVIAKASNFTDTGLQLLPRTTGTAVDTLPEDGFGSNYNQTSGDDDLPF